MQKNEPPTVQKQKEILWDVQLEFISLEVPSNYIEVKDTPEQFQNILQKKAPPKVSKLRTFLSISLTLMQDIAKLQEMIEEISVELQLKKKVKQVQKKCKTGRELRMSA